MNVKKLRTIIISRTDAIGDVVLTLPMASIIKTILGNDVKVLFFGRTYTYPVISCCDSIDGFINYDTFLGFDKKGQVDFLKGYNADAIIHVFPRRNIAMAAKKAEIGERIGTTNRLYHWFSCNKLVALKRKNTSFHEAQLNIRLLKPLGHSGKISLSEITNQYHFNNLPELSKKNSSLLSTDKFKLVIHPKSNTSAREWDINNYLDLIRYLPDKKFQFIITGGKNEEALINEWVKKLPSHVVNLSGKLNLEELIALLNTCDGIIAASTGPLHIAAALGKFALGIFPPIRPMSPVRWAPLGKKAVYLVIDKKCSDCRNAPDKCHCINDITPNMVEKQILQWIK